MTSTGDNPPLERPPGDLPVNELILEIFVLSDMFETKDPLRVVVGTEEIEFEDMAVRRGVGDALEAPSRRRNGSHDPGAPCIGNSSPSGEDARLFCPIARCSERDI